MNWFKPKSAPPCPPIPAHSAHYTYQRSADGMFRLTGRFTADGWYGFTPSFTNPYAGLLARKDNTMASLIYPSILPDNIRVRDLIRKVYLADRAPVRAIEYEAKGNGDTGGVDGQLASYYLMDRPFTVPVLNGYYEDRFADVWRVNAGTMHRLTDPGRTSDPKNYAPFSRLVRVAP